MRTLIAILLFAIADGSPAAADSLRYQSRGSYFEGERAREVSGQRVELLSLAPMGRERVELPKDSLRIEFSLASIDAKPIPRVREAMPATYYWFDRPKLDEKRRGANHFAWARSIADEIGVADSTLHVLVPLEHADPSTASAFAPAVLGYALPDTVVRYRFTFKSADDCTLEFSVLDSAGTAHPCAPPKLEMFSGEVSFVDWPASDRQGPHQLWMRGFSHENNDEIDRLFEFHHEPILTPTASE